MGSRGPLRNPFSVRGQMERHQSHPQPAGVRPKMPPWLAEGSAATWRRVVRGLADAGVPLQRIDAEAIAFYVACIDGAADAGKKSNGRLLARLSRDAIAWSSLIGATPAARARMGIKAVAAPIERKKGGILNGQFRPELTKGTNYGE